MGSKLDVREIDQCGSADSDYSVFAGGALNVCRPARSALPRSTLMTDEILTDITITFSSLSLIGGVDPIYWFFWPQKFGSFTVII